MCNSCEPKKEETLYPFDLEAAKRGEPVRTRDGRRVIGLTMELNGLWLSGQVTPWRMSTNEYRSFSLTGRHSAGNTNLDLFMVNPPKAKEPDLIPFDLEAAKRGEPIQTRDGRKATFLGLGSGALAVVVEVGDELIRLPRDGGFYVTNPSPLDLFMAPKPKAAKTEFVRLVRRRTDGALLTTISRPNPDRFDVIGTKRVTFTEGEFDAE